MIRIAVTDAELKEAIEREKPGWLKRAAERTDKLKIAGRYNERSSIWSEIKPAFMTLQARKCAYCERALAGIEAGKGEHDLEHFRPKGKVSEWPVPGGELAYAFSTGGQLDNGYYWLTYELTNYVTACGPCNQARKHDYFPIAGQRANKDDELNALDERERPLVLFPFGFRDDDPQSFITFHGAIAMPKPGIDEHSRNRARVTIDVFDLNGRDELLTERCAIIGKIWSETDRLENASNERSRKDAKAKIEIAIAPSSPHSSCASAYRELCEAAPDKAWEFNEIAVSYLSSRNESSTVI